MASEWFQTTIGEQVTLQRGIDITRAEQRQGSVPVVSSGGVTSYHDTTAVKGPGVILGRKGVVGSVYYISEDFWPHDTTLWVRDFHGNNRRYVYYFFRAIAHRLSGLDVGSANPTLNRNHVHPIRVLWPKPDVQNAIVEVLSSLDDKIALLRETNATLEAIAQAIFKSWFVDFDPVRAKAEGREPEGMPPEIAELFPSEFEKSELGLVPIGWEAGNIGNIANVVDCLHSKKPELLVVGHPFLQLNNIRNDGLLDTGELACISEADYQKWISRIEVSGGDCVITNVGRVGAVAQIPEGFKAAMGRNMTAIRLLPEYHYPTYLIELLQSSCMRVEIENKTDSGTILNALNVKSIPLLRCVVAPYAVMEVFESITRPLRASMEENVKRIQTIASLRDTLLPRLMSGKLRIPDDGGIAL